MIILALIFGTVFLIPVAAFLTISIANIMMADTLVISVLSGVLLRVALHLHPVFCILVSAAVFGGMTFLYMKEKWFSAFELISMLFWGYLAGFIVHDLSGGDRLWTWLIGMSVCALNYILHEFERHRMCTGS